MFKSSQIISATILLKHFSYVVSHVNKNPQAILITQRNNKHLVLVNAEIFEEMLEKNLKSDGLHIPQHVTDLRGELEILNP